MAKRHFFMVALAKLTDIGGVTETALRGASVLVLEDELLLRKQVTAALEQHEADVTAVGTVDEARRMIASLPFDFALLDVNLPDGLGTDLLSDRVFSPNTAVVVCTAEGGVQGAVEAIRNGAQDYLQKPIDPNVLPMILQRAKAGRQSARLAEHERRNPDATGEQIFFRRRAVRFSSATRQNHRRGRAARHEPFPGVDRGRNRHRQN